MIDQLCFTPIRKCLGMIEDLLDSYDNWADLCVTELEMLDVLKSCNKI